MTSDISSLMDGELSSEEARHVLHDMKQDQMLRDAWFAYHLIGDSLRERSHLTMDISGRVGRRLSDEPTILAPHARQVQARHFPALALAASVSAFGFVGLLAWQVVKLNALPTAPMVAAAPQAVQPQQSAQLASAASPSAKEPASVKFSSAAGNAYLLAHQEFSPSYAVAGMPAYVRTVSEIEPDGGQ